VSLRPPARPARSMRSRPWRRAEFASLDFETTGLDRERDAIVSFGVVPVREGRVVVGEAIHQLVVPEVPSSAESMRIHGILPKDLAYAQPFPAVGHTLRLALAGRFLLAWFAIPVLLHSLVFTWKSERYILLAVPALLLAAGIAAIAGLGALNRWIRSRLNRLTPAWAHGIAAVTVATVAAVAAATTPAFNISRRIPSTRVSNGWDESNRIIRADPNLAGLPLGSAMPLETLYYWGRLDFVVQKALLESWTRDPADREDARPYHLNPVGSPDLYAGRPTLTTPEAIEQAFSDRGAVLIGIQQKYWDYNNVEQSLKTTLERDATELCHDRCGTLRLYYWKFP